MSGTAPVGGGTGNAAADAFLVGLALLTGRATLGPDDPFEAAVGAFLTAVAQSDPEWSPRASYTLGEAYRQRGRENEAEHHLITAIRAGHRDWSPAARVSLGLLAATRGRSADAIREYQAVIASAHPEHAANAWFNLGALRQQSRQWRETVVAFRAAVATGHPEFAPKAAVNLGFVLFNHLGDDAGAREAFGIAVRSGHPEQSRLAAGNLAAMDALSRSRREGTRFAVGEEPTDVSTDRNPASVKRRWWFPRS